jgi:hypothetical protein
MSPDLVTPGSVRSAEVVNEDIRKLWVDPRVQLSGEGRAVLEQLYEEWAAAVRVKVVEAA